MNNKLFLHECPKCRQLRLENTYLKKSVYYSTCKFCRNNEAQEENYMNAPIEYRATLTGRAYNSKNNKKPTHLATLEENSVPQKTAFINAIMLTLCKDYNELPISKETNHKFVNMVIKLSKFNKDTMTFKELKKLVNQTFEYTVALDTIEDTEIKIVVSALNKDKVVGFGHQLGSYDVYNLKTDAIDTKKKTRTKFEKNKTKILSNMLESKKPICYLCHKELPSSEISIDHVKPISHGGTNDPENLDFSCKECNSLKRSQTLETFKPFQEKLLSADKKEQELLNENKSIQNSCQEMEEQIEHLNALVLKLKRREKKNTERLESVKEYKELTIKMSKLESNLHI